MQLGVAMVACGLGLAAMPSAAVAAGGPVPPVQGGAGVNAPGGAVNYVAVGAHGNTVVERVTREGGSVERTRVLRGSFGIPGAAYDGTNTGLTADGRTLVLAAYGRSTRLLVLDARNLRTRGRITLPGTMSVDAIAPDARTLYLIAVANDGNYDVRAYDLPSRRLLREPVVDVRDPEEKLQGAPLTRTMSADGRWVYTLYSGETNFIHALDTSGRTAHCIDLPAGDLSAARMRLEGSTLHVGPHVVDLRTFALAKPAARVTPPPPHEDGGVPWLPLGLGLGALTVLAGSVLQRVRRHPRADPAGEEPAV